MKTSTIILLVGFLLIFVLFFIPLDYFLIAPGPTYNLKDIVIMPEKYDNHIYAPSVAPYYTVYFSFFNSKHFNKFNTNLFYLMYGIIHPDVDVKQLSTYMQQTTTQQYEFTLESLTTTANERVKMFAASYLNISSDELNVNFTLDSQGSSASAALALEVIHQLSAKDFTKGLSIGAVGDIDSEGSVLPVSFITYKIRSAQKHSLDILFIPEKNYREDLNGTQFTLPLVPVSSVPEIIKYLSEQ